MDATLHRTDSGALPTRHVCYTGGVSNRDEHSSQDGDTQSGDCSLPGGGGTKVMYFTHYKTKYILYDDMGRVIISTRDKNIIRKTAERIKNDTRRESTEVPKRARRKKSKDSKS
tara:strand:- start:374 stop:715 length:342 start_codon:yes stop_codon:yes gene_type:complete